MRDEADVFRDPEFQKRLKRRSRWRWGLSGLLIGAYLVWSVGGVYFPAAYAAPVPGSALPWGIVVGMLIITCSIVLSVVYVRIVNRLEEAELREQETNQ
jgi:uncharacterized membrane protein (DUF485 family)